MPMGEVVETAVKIEGCQSLAAIKEAVRDFAKPYGYDRYVLYSISSADDDVVDRIYWVEGDWFGNDESVDAITYIRHCPVTRHIVETDKPFFWTKTYGTDGERYRVVRKPQGNGIHGLQIPIFGPHGLEGAMSFGGERVDSSSKVRLSINLVAISAFFSARNLIELPKGEGSGRLSRRECEVLAWVAAGRRQADIAATLGLSIRTVENHLRRARRHLGVITTAEAIRIAIRNGDIDG